MYKIFRKHYEVFFRRAFHNKEATENFYQEINKFKRNKDFKDGEILHRFPKKELRYFLRSECPTERHQNQKGVKNYEIIKASKRLRYFANIPENFVCTRCSKRETCKFRDLLPKSKETSVSDLLIVTNGLYDYQNKLYGAGKAQEQKKENENEHELNNEKLEDVEENEDEDEDEETLSEDKNAFEESEDLTEDDEDEASEETQELNQDIHDRYSYKTYESAIKVIDSLYPVVEDINYRKGFGCKQFINSYIGENKKLGKLRQDVEEGESEDEGFEDSPNRNKNKRGTNERPKMSSDKKSQTQNLKKDNISWGTKPERVSRNDKFRSRSQTEFEESDEDLPRKNEYVPINNKNTKFGRQTNYESRDETPSRMDRERRPYRNKSQDDEFKLKESQGRFNKQYLGKDSARNYNKTEKRTDRFNSKEAPKRNLGKDQENPRNEKQQNRNFNEKGKRNENRNDRRTVKLDNFMHDIKNKNY